MKLVPFILLLLILLSKVGHSAETRGLRVVAKDSATNQTAEVKLYNKSYAVIIGIDRYQNLPSGHQLSYAVKDAEGISATLKKHYKFDRIATLYNQEATKERIMKLLTSELPRDMGPDDAVFIFWAGHGNQDSSADGEIGYLIPYDGSADEIYKNITMTEIRDTVSKKLPAKHVFYAFDACYSGLLTTRGVDTKSRRDLAYMKEITKERVRQVLTAGSKGQEVLDGGRNGHSVFTGRLIEILEAQGDYITANEIQAIIKEKVYGDAIGRGLNQKPDFGRLSGTGDFVFIPNIEQKVQDNRAEIVKLEQELAAYKASEERARKSRNERERRDAEQQRKTAEAKLAAEKLRQQQMVDEERRRKELDQDRAKFDEEQKRKEQELAQARSAEYRRLAELKAEVERKKKNFPAASETTNLQTAIAEIRLLNTRINDIVAPFDHELEAGKKRITTRYDAEIADVRKASKAKQEPVVRGEFESKDKFDARITAQKSSFDNRINDLRLKKQAELAELEQRISREKGDQTASLRASLKELSGKEYILDPTTLILEVGRYDTSKQTFPVTLKNKTLLVVQPTLQPKKGKKNPSIQQVAHEPEGVKITMNGSIFLPVETAEQFKTHFAKGWVRPEVTVRAGDAKVTKIVIANDAENYLLENLNGEFITKSERNRREVATAAAEQDRLIYVDKDTNLMWARDANIAGATMSWGEAMNWTKKLRFGGYNDWRLPTYEELKSFARQRKGNLIGWFNANGFYNVFPHHYWSSTGAHDSDTPYYIYLPSGDMDWIHVSNLNCYALPVRDVNAQPTKR